MKITILSLLRVGDVLMQVHLLRALKAEFPHAEITMVVNDGVEKIAPLVPEIDHWCVFPRSAFQSTIGTAEYHLLRPLRDLQNWLFDSFHEPSDVLLNFTHNRLSAYLASLIPAKIRRGLQSSGRRFAPFENRWQRYLNDRFPMGSPCSFHYIDLLAGAFDLQVPSIHPVRSLIPMTLRNTVYLQTLTSQKNKQKSPRFWIDLVNAGKSLFPDTDWVVLGAPFEESTLRQNFPNLNILTVDWPTLAQKWNEKSILITGDTSVKHLAALMGVQTVEVGVPGVDPWRTGAYGSEHFYLEGADDETHIEQIVSILSGSYHGCGFLQSEVDASGYHLVGAKVAKYRRPPWRAAWRSYLDGDEGLYPNCLGGEDLKDLVEFFQGAEHTIEKMRSLLSVWQGAPLDKSFLFGHADNALLEDEFFELRLLVPAGASSSLSYMGVVNNTLNNIQEKISKKRNFFGLNQQEKFENGRDGAIFKDGIRTARESDPRNS